MNDYTEYIDRYNKAKNRSNLFGHNMDIALHRRHMSQAELAELIGVNHGTISSYHTGKTSPTLTNAIMICGVLGVSLESMITTRYTLYENGN